jgi:hypothetical protein
MTVFDCLTHSLLNRLQFLFNILQMFTGLAKDRFERLNKTPSASQWMHGKTFLVLILVLISDVAW